MYIPSHQELGNHPKLRRLARTLAISRPAAVGHLHYLWWWSLTYADDGCIPLVCEVPEIASIACWEGDPDAFVNALIDVGFLDLIGDRLYLHNWQQHSAKQLWKETRDAWDDIRAVVAPIIFMRDQYTCQYCGLTDLPLEVDHIIPISKGGGNGFSNLCASCVACNRSKSAKTVEEWMR